MPHLLILVSSEKHKKNNLEKFCNFPDSLLLTRTCNYALTKCSSYFLISYFSCHSKGIKEIFCEFFRWFQFLFIKQGHAYYVDQNYIPSKFSLQVGILNFLCHLQDAKKRVVKSFGFLLLLSWISMHASSINQKLRSYIF